MLKRELASEREQLAALAAKLQRAEAQRRAQADEVHGLAAALAAAKQEAADVRGLLAAAEQRAAALSEEAERRWVALLFEVGCKSGSCSAVVQGSAVAEGSYGKQHTWETAHS